MPTFRCLGTDVTVYPGARIIRPETISLGSHVIVDDFVFVGAHQELRIGSYVHVAAHASITGGGRCLICDFVNISSGVRIVSGTDDFQGGGLAGPVVPPEFRNVTRGTVVIHAHVIVGANSVVLPNVTIGEGVTIGAGSVVTRDLAPWTIYAGAPARPLKPRDKATILRYEQQLYQTYGPSDHRLRYPPDGYGTPVHPAHPAAA